MNESEEFEDRTLKCVDCGEDFTWAAGEQDYFREKGLTNDPKRCQECRQANKQRRVERDARKGAGA
ncbi:MAG: zinc-ribbon domain-containing protein [Acidobacteriota bacterium]|nr:zinc-ribbon domain-containing protein [Acidobacteriota bacterium]